MRRPVPTFLRAAGLLLAALLLLPLLVRADDFPPRPSPPRLVNDLSNVLSTDEEALLERKLRQFSSTTSNQVTIITLGSVGTYDISDYATQLARKWGIGMGDKDNGVLILAAMQDHKVFIAVGKGLEGALPDITAGQIVREQIRPAFRQNAYYQGLSNAVDAIIAATKGEYKAEGGSGGGGIGVGAILMLVLVIYLVIWFISRRGGGGGSYMSRRGGFDSFGGGFLTGTMLGGGFGGGSSGGFGGGGDSGGGFGGFGGGDFGGGGAGGDW